MSGDEYDILRGRGYRPGPVHWGAPPPAPAVPDNAGLREALAQVVYDRDSLAGDLHWSRTHPDEQARCRRVADALLSGPLAAHGPRQCVSVDDANRVLAESRATIAALLAERDDLAAKVARFEELFSGGPDSSCRTTYPEGIECAEVPMVDLRWAFEGDPT